MSPPCRRRLNTYSAAGILGAINAIPGKGAVAGLISGFILGMAKLAAQALVGSAWAAGSLPGFVVALGEFNWLYFCLALFAVSVMIIVGVSLLTGRPPAAKTDGDSASHPFAPSDERPAPLRRTGILGAT